MADSNGKLAAFDVYYQFPGEVQEYNMDWPGDGFINDQEEITLENVELFIEEPLYLLDKYTQHPYGIEMRVGIRDDAKDGSKHVVYAVFTNTVGVKAIEGFVVIVQTIEAAVAASVETAKAYERRLVAVTKRGRPAEIAAVLAQEPLLEAQAFATRLRVEGAKWSLMDRQREQFEAEIGWREEKAKKEVVPHWKHQHEQEINARYLQVGTLKTSMLAQEGIIQKMVSERAAAKLRGKP